MSQEAPNPSSLSLRIGSPQSSSSNSISTTKYTFYNFFFLNLFEQFQKVANVYFLILSMLQMIPGVSITDNIPTMLPPLTFILLLSMAKDVYEDYKRYKSDREENLSDSMVFDKESNCFRETKWQNIKIGDVVKVEKNEFFPCDLVLVYSSDFKNGQCFVETKNLDGETNLKSKAVVGEIFDGLVSKREVEGSNISQQQDLESLKTSLLNESITTVENLCGSDLEAELPNQYLSKFKGKLVMSQNEVPLNVNSFLLRGCTLRNTDFIVGVAVYTGHDSKIMKNSIKARPKKSNLDILTGKIVLLTFIIQMSICFFAGAFYSVWYNKNKDIVKKYMTRGAAGQTDNPFKNFVYRSFNWLLIFGNFVPISLLLTLETVKFFQGSLMSMDPALVTHGNSETEENEDGENHPSQKKKKAPIAPQVQSSSLNEELGQIDYVFSDKTGTLTANEMRFKFFMVGPEVYGVKRGYTGPRPKVKNVDFEDPLLWQHLSEDSDQQQGEKLKLALRLLGLCHSVVIDADGELDASSPDELAFVNFSKLMLFEYSGLDDENWLSIKEKDGIKRYRLLDLIEFNSDRKRMTVIVQDESGQITMFSKGADSIMMPRYHPEKMDNKTDIVDNVENFAAQGFRTLFLGHKSMTQEEYNTFKTAYDQAKNDLQNREEEMAKVEDEWEREFELTGATAIEDRLQDEVPQTIEFMRQAGIKVWVLTGDKVDTAKNIGYSCNLLTRQGMTLLQIPDGFDDLDKLEQEVDILLEKQKQELSRNLKTALLVTGATLEFIWKHSESRLKVIFVSLALNSNVVLCCRVSPKQKQEIVEMVKLEKPDAITLSIGDGANDVNMITEAHVGIGIKGHEGQQAARASDFSIGEFKMLKRLLFFHGREWNRRNSLLILYNFFKNIILCLPQFWYSASNNWSGQTLYEKINYQLFNLIFSSVPIIIYALFDRQTCDIVLLSDPIFYSPGPHRVLFSVGRFSKWFLAAAIQGAITVFFALVLFDTKFSVEEGQTFGFWAFGQAMFLAAVILSNLKILTFSSSVSLLQITVMLISVGSAFVFWKITSIQKINPLHLTMEEMFAHPHFGIFLIGLVAISLIDWAVHKLVDLTLFKQYVPPSDYSEWLTSGRYSPSVNNTLSSDQDISNMGNARDSQGAAKKFDYGQIKKAADTSQDFKFSDKDQQRRRNHTFIMRYNWK